MQIITKVTLDFGEKGKIELSLEEIEQLKKDLEKITSKEIIKWYL